MGFEGFHKVSQEEPLRRDPSNASLRLLQLLFDGWRLRNEQLLLQLHHLMHRASGLYEAFGCRVSKRCCRV